MPLFSFFPNAYDVTPVREVTIREFLAGVKDGTYKGQIEPLRKLVADGDMTTYKKQKELLPAASLSARAITRAEKTPLPEKLLSHSHALQVDADGKDIPNIEALFEEFKKDPYILFCYRSPSGKGLKACVRIDGTQHLASFQSAEKHFLEKYNVRIDTSVKDVIRLCFASYDPDLFINESAQILPISINGTPKTADNHFPMPSQPLDLADEELLDRARKADNGAKFSRLFDSGDCTGYSSPSESDLALCGMLAFWFGRDKERMNRVFRQSKLYREKWDRHNYSGKTLDKAIKLCTEVYTPKTKPQAGDGERPDGGWSPGFSQESLRTCETASEGTQKNLAGIEFPAHVMSGFAGDFARIYSEYLEPPIQFFYMAIITCLGNILSGLITLESAIAPQPRFNVLLLGESADDRKSTVLEKLVEFFRAFSFEKLLNVCHGVGSAEGLQAKLSDLATNGGPKRLLLVYDEFKSFVGKCKIEGSVLLPCVTTLFESNHYESRTKTTKSNWKMFT